MTSSVFLCNIQVLQVVNEHRLLQNKVIFISSAMRAEIHSIPVKDDGLAPKYAPSAAFSLGFATAKRDRTSLFRKRGAAIILVF